MSEPSGVLALLDELHAAEDAGAAAMARWIEVAADPALRGGLRVIAARDRAHDTLACDRLRALGGAPAASPRPGLVELLRLIESADVPDEVKLRAMAARLPADHGDRVRASATRIAQDLETRALVETMGDDDRVSLAWLRAMAERGSPAPPAGAADPDAAARGLAALALAEAASASVFEAWRAACSSAGLRGGLRTIAARESTHATLLTARLRALGAAGADHGAAPDVAAAIARWGDRAWSDEAKLDALLARYATPESAAAPAAAIARVADTETRAMLQLMADGEQATMAWLRAYRRAEPGRLDNLSRFG
jgi:hypothetical protein